MTAFETLRELMPPTADSDTPVNWERLSETWGRRFPEDYRRFIETYGAGAIQNYLEIQRPESRWEVDESPTSGMVHETANAENAWIATRKSSELAETAPKLIAWGADASADILCWDASDDDPESWPVLVYNRSASVWRRYDFGMVEFLVRVLRAEFADCPLGDLALWGKRSAIFLNATEEQRLFEEGLDPWTGEPDPYAGMF